MKKKEKARLLLQQRWDRDHKWDCLTNEEVCQRLNQWVIEPKIPEKPLPKKCKRYQEDLIHALRVAVKDPKVRPNIQMVFASKVQPGMIFPFMDRDRMVVAVEILSLDADRGAVDHGYIKFDDGMIKHWGNRQPKFYRVHIVTNKPTPQRPPDYHVIPSKWSVKKVRKTKPKIPYVKRADRTDPITGVITGMGEIRRAAWRQMGIQVREPAKKKTFYNPDVVGDIKTFKRKHRKSGRAKPKHKK